MRHCWILASIVGVLVGGLVGTFFWFAVPERYSAEFRIRVRAPSEDRAHEGDTSRWVRTQAEAIQSTGVLESVLRRPEVQLLTAIRDERDPLVWLSNHLSVVVDSIPDILFIRVHASSAEEAIVLIRAIAEVHRAALAHQRESSLRHIEDARSHTEATLRQKQERLAQLQNPRLLAAVKECEQARFDCRIARAELADREQRHPENERVNVSDQAILAYLKEDVVGRERLYEIQAIEEKIQKTLRVSVAKEHDPNLPAFLQAREAVSKRLKARGEEVRPLVEQRERQRMEGERRALKNRSRERADFYERLVKSLEEEVRSLGGSADVAQEVKTLREESAAATETLRKLAKEEELLRGGATAASCGQTDEPVVVGHTDGKERIRPAILGGVGCGLLLMFAVSWREARRGRITSSRDITSGLGTIVGNIPCKRLTPALARQQFQDGGSVNEAVDALRTVLLQDTHKGPRLLLVTSAVGGEGKTSLAALLAASLARAWRRTLLLDADLRKPQAHELFDLPLEPGLSEVLRGEAEIADTIQPTELSRLWMIPAGHGDAHALQALAQDGAGRLFDPLKEQFDFIVLDTCPILPVADVLLLCPHVDTVLLAVRSGVSRLTLVRAAQQRLATLHAPLRGAVLIGPDDDLAGSSLSYPS